jgi:hypothetical protein
MVEQAVPAVVVMVMVVLEQRQQTVVMVLLIRAAAVAAALEMVDWAATAVPVSLSSKYLLRILLLFPVA